VSEAGSRGESPDPSVEDRPESAVTVAVMNYNGRDVIGPTLEILTGMTGDDTHLMVVDNGSTDGSPDWVKENFPGIPVHVISQDGSLSRARNWALDHAPTRYVFLCDNDLHVDAGCLDELLTVLTGGEDVLAVTPRMVYLEDPSRIHNEVGRVHYLGVSGESARGRSVEELPPGGPEPTIPGGIALVDRRLARELGGFDLQYDHGWGMDAEYYIRGLQRGMRCLHASRALTRHPVPAHGSGRAEAQIHNRYRFLLTLYRGRTLLLMAPPLLAFEVALLGLFTFQGLLGDWVGAVRRVISRRRELGEVRERVQAARREPDRIYLEGTGFSAGGPFGRSGLIQTAGRVADVVFGTWWAVFGRFC